MNHGEAQSAFSRSLSNSSIIFRERSTNVYRPITSTAVAAKVWDSILQLLSLPRFDKKTADSGTADIPRRLILQKTELSSSHTARGVYR